MSKIDMKEYGLNEALIKKASNFHEFYVGRVLSQSKGIYQVVCENGKFFAEISGKFRYRINQQLDYPAVGDFVLLDRNYGNNGNGIIHYVLSRKSAFIRKASGKTGEEQVVAANVDTLFICMSVNNDFNLRRLERYLALAWESGARPVVVLTKVDLSDDIQSKFRAVASVAIGVDILGISALEKDGYEDVIPYISKGQTVALLGSSGTGKSTLVNRLIGQELLDTRDIRNDDRGRHTTTKRELILLPGRGMIIDTPGMRELGMWGVKAGFDRSFSDVERFLGKCHFRDCTHTIEPDCAIYTAIKNGELSEKRWRSYLKLKVEDAFNENRGAYLEKKELRFKNIAKLNKSRNLW